MIPDSSNFEACCNWHAFFYDFMTEIILALLLIVTLVLSYLERKELNNRLMAKDLRDYVSNTAKEEKNQIDPETDETLSLEEARETIEEQING